MTGEGKVCKASVIYTKNSLNSLAEKDLSKNKKNMSGHVDKNNVQIEISS